MGALELATETTEGTDGVPGGKGVVKKGQWVLIDRAQKCPILVCHTMLWLAPLNYRTRRMTSPGPQAAHPTVDAHCFYVSHKTTSSALGCVTSGN